jgi:hypothetical protein
MSKQYLSLTIDKHSLQIIDVRVVGPCANIVSDFGISPHVDFILPIDVKASGVYLEVGDIGK